jgi:uncharacterized protein (DUF1778 family)
MTAAAAGRFEFRLRPEAKKRIERAAQLVNQSASDFARTAVEERAEQVLREHDVFTTVPGDFFDELLEALDRPPVGNEALAKAARLSRDVVRR